jgi:hypothetical protein
MRRLMSIAAFAVLLSLPLWAQRGGGHAAGGHGGSFGGHSGFSGGHVGGGMHSGPSAGRGFTHSPSFSQRSFSQRSFANRGFSNRPFLHDGFRGNRFRAGFGNRFRDRGFRRNCFGFGCRSFAYPWAYGYYDPYWWWDSGSSYDEDYERDRALANEMNEQNLEEQQMLRQEEADGDEDRYARSSPPPRTSDGDRQQATATVPATVLVFADQRQKEIRNYAIVGQMLWNFTPQRTEKIPLSELDLTATEKANDERGVTFRVPASNEAQ